MQPAIAALLRRMVYLNRHAQASGHLDRQSGLIRLGLGEPAEMGAGVAGSVLGPVFKGFCCAGHRHLSVKRPLYHFTTKKPTSIDPPG